MMNLLSNLSHGPPDIEASIAKIIAPIQCGLKALPPTIDRSYTT